MTTQNNNAPALRFPEFNEDWNLKKVVDFAPLQRGFDLPVNQIIEGEYPVVFSNGILKTHNEFKAKAPGVVTGRSGTIGKVTYVEKDYWAHNTALWVTDFKENHPKYVYYFYINFDLERFASGSGVPTLNRNDVHSQKVFIPTLPEQQKIAAFLTAVDEKIQQLAKKKDLLEQYKKGVMQKIFNQEIRFKDDDGNDFADWEEKKLSEVASKIQDGTHFSPNTSDTGDFLYLTSKNVKNGYIDLSNVQYIDKESHDSIYKRCDVKFGDILITKDGTIGQICVNDLSEPFSLLSSVAFIRPNGLANNYFIYHLLTSEIGQKEITGVIAGQALKRITLTKINNFKFSLPCIEEQIKIAKFLSVIDDKINLVNQQLEKTKEYKKGLLQQMFV